MIQKERIVSSRSTQDIEKLINQLTSGKSFTVKNWTEKRDFDTNISTLGDVANVLSTLINDLISKGIIQK